jgi:hypothetical protein
MTSALEADELTADRLVLDRGESAPAAYSFDTIGELVDRERRVLAGSTEGSARVVADRRC